MLAMAISTAGAYDFMVNDLAYNINSDSTSVSVTYQIYVNGNSPRYPTLKGAISIPNSISYNDNTYTVTSIGENSFSGCTAITSVTIGNSVTSIGDWAFW